MAVMANRKSQTEIDVRQQRVILLREIAALIAEQQKWYRDYVLPAAAEARMKSPMSRFSGRSSIETSPLKLEVADALGDETPTDRFQKGVAHVEHLSTRIRSLRTREAKLARVITAPPPSVARQIDWVGRLERRANDILGRT